MKDDLDALNVLIDENSPEHCVGVREEFLRLAAAFEALPIECRDVVWLRKVERLTQKDVSRRLGVPQRTIEKRVARGIRILAKAVFGEATDHKIQAEVSTDRAEREHG
jgi:RNA polymerase sigma-70 factor (ECF subfamily)